MYNLKNKVQLIGNLGQDPEIKESKNGKKYTKFTLATNEIYKNDAGEKVEETQWHNIQLWGKIAEIAAEYLRKGSQCAIEGKLTYRKYTDDKGIEKYFTQIVGRELLLLGKRENTASLVEEKEEVLPF